MLTRVRRLLGAYGFALGPSVASVAGSAVTAGATLFVARGIGAVEFGGYMVVLTLALILVTVGLMSLNFVMYQELPRAPAVEHPAMIATALGVGLALLAAVAAATLAAIPVLVPLLDMDAATLRFAVLLSSAIGVNLLGESFLRGTQRYAHAANLKLAVAAAYVTAVVIGLLVLDIDDFGSYVALFAAANAGYGLFALVGLEIRPRSFMVARASAMLRHGGHISVIALLMTMVFGLDVIFVNWFQAPDVVGIYSLYSGFPKRLLTIVLTEGVGLVLLPTLATLDKPRLLRRLRALAPVLWLGATVPTFVASAVFFLFLRGEYPYSLSLMALAAVGLGTHAVFNLYFFALSMDGTRGARVVIASLLVGMPAALGIQVLLIRSLGLAGGLVAFALTNLILIAIIIAAAARVYRAADPPDARVGDRSAA